MMYWLMPRGERSDLSTSKVSCQVSLDAMGWVELPRVVVWVLLCLLAHPAIAATRMQRNIRFMILLLLGGSHFNHPCSRWQQGRAHLSLLHYFHGQFRPRSFSCRSALSADHAADWAGRRGGVFASGDQGVAID